MGSFGIELWRSLGEFFDPLVENRKLENTMDVMNPSRAPDGKVGLGKLGSMIATWEHLYAEHRREYGDTFPEAFRSAILYRMMPASLEAELLTEHYKYKAYDELRNQIFLIMHTRTSGHAPMMNNVEEEASQEHIVINEDDGEVFLLQRQPDGSFQRKPKGNGKGKGSGHGAGKGKYVGSCFKCGSKDPRAQECKAVSICLGSTNTPPQIRHRGGLSEKEIKILTSVKVK